MSPASAESCRPFTGNFQVKVLSQGCHSFDLSFLFIHPHVLVGLERGVRGIEPGLDSEILGIVKVRRDLSKLSSFLLGKFRPRAQCHGHSVSCGLFGGRPGFCSHPRTVSWDFSRTVCGAWATDALIPPRSPEPPAASPRARTLGSNPGLALTPRLRASPSLTASRKDGIPVNVFREGLLHQCPGRLSVQSQILSIQKTHEGCGALTPSGWEGGWKGRGEGRGPLTWLLSAHAAQHCQEKKRCERGFKPGPRKPRCLRGLGGGCGNQRAT